MNIKKLNEELNNVLYNPADLNYKTNSEYTQMAQQAIDIINNIIEDEEITAEVHDYSRHEVAKGIEKIGTLKKAIEVLTTYINM